MNNDIVPGFDDERTAGLAIVLEGILVVRLEGCLDHTNGDAFARKLDRAADAGFTRIALELEGLGYADDIGVLVRAAQSLRARGGGLALAGLEPRAVEVLELLGFTRLFTVADGLDDAVAGLAAVSPGPGCPPTGGTAGTRAPRLPGTGASGRRG